MIILILIESSLGFFINEISIIKVICAFSNKNVYLLRKRRLCINSPVIFIFGKSPTSNIIKFIKYIKGIQ